MERRLEGTFVFHCSSYLALEEHLQSVFRWIGRERIHGWLKWSWVSETCSKGGNRLFTITDTRIFMCFDGRVILFQSIRERSESMSPTIKSKRESTGT